MTAPLRSVPVRLALAGLLVLALALGLAARASAPDGRYLVTNTTVQDRRTGLVWTRQVPADPLSQVAAKAACASDLDDGGQWRLPTTAELLTLVDVTAAAPAIDGVAFPGSPVGRYWTATPYVRADGQYWAVDFNDGSDGGADKTLPLPYRCVKSEAVAP